MILPNTDSDIAKKSRMEEIHTRLTSLAHVNWHLTTQLLWMDPLLILYSIWFSQCCTLSYSWTFLWNKISTLATEVYYSFSNNYIFPVLIELIFHFLVISNVPLLLAYLKSLWFTFVCAWLCAEFVNEISFIDEKFNISFCDVTWCEWDGWMKKWTPAENGRKCAPLVALETLVVRSQRAPYSS